MKLLVVCLLGTLLASGAAASGAKPAQSYIFRVHNVSDGLSDSEVRSINLAPNGLLVVRTSRSLNIYDGASFRQYYYNHEAVPYNENTGQQQDYFDQSNRMWLTEPDKLWAFDFNTREFVYDVADLLPGQSKGARLQTLFIDDSLDHWIIDTAGGLHKYSPAKRTLLAVGTERAQSGEAVIPSQIVRRGQQCWILYRNNVLRCWDEGQGKFLPGEHSLARLPSLAVARRMIAAPDGGLWILYSNALYRYDTRERSIRQVSIRLGGGDLFTAMDIDRRGDLWLGSSKSGLRIIRGTGFDVEQLPHLALVSGEQISHNTDITALHIDRDDGVWIATLTEGLLYYHPAMNKLRLINNKTTPGQRMPDQNIKCMVEQGDGTILLGTVRGLLRYDPLTGTIDIPYPRLERELCIGLMRDSRGRIWLGTFQNGLFCIDGERIRHYKYGAMPQVHISYYNSTPNLNNVRTFFEQRDGGMWVSVYGGIGRFDRQTGEVDLLAGRFPRIGRMMVVRNIEYLNDSTLFVASDNGMYLYDTFHDTVTLDPPGFPASLRSARFNCTMTDRRGLLWMAVSEGLFVYDPFKRRSVRIEGLPSSNVYSVVEDARGEVWLSTFGNISKVAIAGTPDRWEFTLTNFNSYDGVQASSFFEHSALCSSDGKVYFGGTHGMNVAEPERIVYNTTDLRPQFTDLRLFNTPVERGARYGGRVVMSEPVNLTREVLLAHDQNFISIDFAGLNYVNPTQTYFRYRLEGLDERWTEIHSSNGQGRATYTSLPPGRYSLTVYAANNDKLWGSQPARMDIVIKPPLWGTVAARVFYCLLALVVLWAVWLTMMRRASRRLREQRQVEALRQKEELDQLKFRFFTNISHELRTPLTLITVPLNTISRKIADPDIRSQLGVVQRNAGQLLSLINQLLDFRKLEMKGETLKLTGGYIDVFLEDIFRSFAELAAEKMVNYEFENRMDEHVSIYFDRAKLQRICNNLLSNAFKYTPGGGGVKLILEMVGDRIAITVADTGVGIPEEQLPHIFDRFYRIDDSRADSLTGSGIGLHLIREYVALHGGTIEVESRPGEGARFTVSLPANLAPDNFEQSIPHDDIPAPVAPPESGERKTILLVEDNEEFRHYLKHELQERYRIVEAQDGEQGARQAVEQRPDLIITDMMMPVMDGVQMCRRLKNDIETSHIPIVLLTARQSDENKLVGYQAGADDYIAKPFNFDLLLLRVNNLIEQQRGRREAFARNIDVSPAKITITSLDELLVKKVLACVERNIDNPDYSVEQLSAEVNMHRMNLYRKLHSIVGQTPSEFIRAIRLKRAAQLLQQSRLPVTEIAEMVGFNTPKYFTRYFKQMFGTTPSAYAARFK